MSKTEEYCPLGYYCPAGSEMPLPCPDGHYCPVVNDTGVPRGKLVSSDDDVDIVFKFLHTHKHTTQTHT